MPKGSGFSTAIDIRQGRPLHRAGHWERHIQVLRMNDQPSVPVQYHDSVVRQFTLMAVVWGVVGMLVGVFIAAQLAWPELNFGIPWLSYGRLRPLHTNAVRSEEHTSELQSQFHLVCRLLLEQKKKAIKLQATIR